MILICANSMIMHRLWLRIGEASEALGVSITTLRRWEAAGKLVAAHTVGGHRRDDLGQLRPELLHAADRGDRLTLCYACVPRPDQQARLDEQKRTLERYCTRRAWTFEVLADLGSGVGYHKQGLERLLDAVIERHIGRLVMTHQDRLLRLGAELVFSLCEAKNVEVVILNQNLHPAFEEDLAQDVLDIIAIFSARLYGARSRKNQKLLDSLRHAVEAAGC